MAAPTAVRVEARSMTTAILRWTYGGSAPLEIHRSTDGAAYSIAATLDSSTETDFTDTDLDPATKYWYKISDDAGATFSSVVTVFTHACDNQTVGTVFGLPRFDGEEQQAAELNALAERIEQAFGEQVIDPDQCAVCPEEGAIVLDCTNGCNSFIVIADENINSISINACGGEGPAITFVIPPNQTIQICGWPSGYGFTGDECSQAPIVGGTAGRTVSAGGGAGVGGGGAPSSKKGTQGLKKKKRKKPGSPTGGAGGVGGSDCECVPGTEGQLTIRCCTTDCLLTCGSTKKLRIRVCGGVGPYTLVHTGSVTFTGTAASADGATAESESGQIVEIIPPTNAGSGVAGNAYRFCKKTVDSDFAGDSVTTENIFGCDDAFIACNTSPVGCASTPCCEGPGDTGCVGGSFDGCRCWVGGAVPCTQCGRTFGTFEDLRTAPMIAANCNPCGLQSGVVITATDATGASVAITLGV